MVFESFKRHWPFFVVGLLLPLIVNALLILAMRS